MSNHCIACGDIIPEGRTICWRCEHDTGHPVFSDIESANNYCKFAGWDAWWIRRGKDGYYTVGELKGATHEYAD